MPIYMCSTTESRKHSLNFSLSLGWSRGVSLFGRQPNAALSARGWRASLAMATPCHLYRPIESSNPVRSKSLELTLICRSLIIRRHLMWQGHRGFGCVCTHAPHPGRYTLIWSLIWLTTDTFICSIRHFASRRGLPSTVISDNGKTFKSATELITQILEHPELRKYFSQLYIEWQFKLERAPWCGGIFERMVKSAKQCLRKSVGKYCLSHDELLTLVNEVEAGLNSRPLTYLSSENVEEPRTPLHLLVKYRLLTFPDRPTLEDPDYSRKGLTHRANHLYRTL